MNDMWNLLIIFLVIVLMINLTKKLWLGLLCGILCSGILFHIPILTYLKLLLEGATAQDTLTMVLTLYFVTFIQRIMEQNGSITSAQQAVDKLCNNRRISTFLSPTLIGLLPSAAIVKICGNIVDVSAGEYLDKEEKTFIASYYRHIFESCLPTYSAILVITSLGGVAVGRFILLMLPMVAVEIIIGYVLYLRKIPKDTGLPPSSSKKQDLLTALEGLWPLILIVVLILVFGVPTLYAMLTALILYYLLSRIGIRQLPKLMHRAFEGRLIANMFLIYVFKHIISYTESLQLLPGVLSTLPLPSFLIYGLVFFLGAFVGGSNMIIAIGTPLAVAAMPEIGAPLIVYLNCCAYIAMQISPTHVCLAVATEHFGTSMWGLTKKTLPAIVLFLSAATAYYLLLQAML